MTSIVRYVIKTFLLHASIVKPLGEWGKLQLTSDMTDVEFALNAFIVDTPHIKNTGGLEAIGSEYKSLRAMRYVLLPEHWSALLIRIYRPLLFLENNQLTSSKYTEELPVLIVLHHILVRSPIPLPHVLHGWQEAEYVQWVSKHSEIEAFNMVDTGISHWEKVAGSDGEYTAEAAEYVQLARTVLQQAR